MTILDQHRAGLAALAARDRRRALTHPAGIDFTSNDYLGLASSPELAAAITDAVAQGVPIGSSGSRLLRGNHPQHEMLEAESAAFFGSEASLFFSSGYAANITIFSTLPRQGDLIVHDALIHASAHEGMRIGRADHLAAVHNDVGAFADAIRRWRDGGGRGRVWIAAESLYSMDGDRAPLTELADLADRNDAFLIVDEAHATGVFGRDGRGLADQLDGRDNVVTLRTCGKALGCEGALVCLPVVLRDHLVNRGRGFIYSTAPSPLMAAAVRAALRLTENGADRRDALNALIAFAETRLTPLGIASTGSQIIPIVIGRDGPAMAAAAELQQAGFDVRGIRPPTVPAGSARLRIALTLNASHANVSDLSDAIGAAMARL